MKEKLHRCFMAWVMPAVQTAASLLPVFMQLFGHKNKGGVNQGNDEFQKLSTMTGGQEGLLQQLMQGMQGGGFGGGPMGMGMQNLSDILSNSPEAMAKFEKPYMTQFQQEIVPHLAEQFAGIGSGSQGSSAFGQALGGAGAGLSERLASLRGGLQQNALSQLMGMMQTGLGSQAFGYGHRTPPKGFMESVLPGLATGAGQMGGAWAMNKMFGGAGGAGSSWRPSPAYQNWMTSDFKP